VLVATRRAFRAPAESSVAAADFNGANATRPTPPGALTVNVPATHRDSIPGRQAASLAGSHIDAWLGLHSLPR